MGDKKILQNFIPMALINIQSFLEENQHYELLEPVLVILEFIAAHFQKFLSAPFEVYFPQCYDKYLSY